MAYWTYIDDETKEQLTLCDFADLAPIAAEQARESLRTAYGDPDDNTPDFEAMTAEALNVWSDTFGVLFDPGDGTIHWTDAAETVTQNHYLHPDFKDELFTFADLPDDAARRAAVVWLWEEESLDEIWDSSEPEDVSLDVARDASNFLERLWDCSGQYSVSISEAILAD